MKSFETWNTCSATFVVLCLSAGPFECNCKHYGHGWLYLFDWGLTSLSASFSHIATMSGCGRELNAHFKSAASLKYHAPDTLT